MSCTAASAQWRATTSQMTDVACGASLDQQSEYCIRETSLAALHLGHPVVLVRGAHATYDGEVPARARSEAIETELRTAGVSVLDSAELPF